MGAGGSGRGHARAVRCVRVCACACTCVMRVRMRLGARSVPKGVRGCRASGRGPVVYCLLTVYFLAGEGVCGEEGARLLGKVARVRARYRVQSRDRRAGKMTSALQPRLWSESDWLTRRVVARG